MGETQEPETPTRHTVITVSAAADFGDTIDNDDQHLLTTVTTTCSKERRNGLWNIFDGVDPSVLENMGLSADMVRQLVSTADESVSECLSQLATSSLTVSDGGDRGDGGCGCQRSYRMHRSASTTAGEEMQAAMQNRHRRNAVGNLFEVLTLSQKLMLVEHLQTQLEKLNRLPVPAMVVPAAGSVPVRGVVPLKGGDESANNDNDNADIVLSLSGLSLSLSSSSSSSSSSSGNSSKSSSPRPQSEIVWCH